MLTINLEKDKVDEAGGRKEYGKTGQSILLPLQGYLADFWLQPAEFRW
jgi:hypothetical protein